MADPIENGHSDKEWPRTVGECLTMGGHVWVYEKGRRHCAMCGTDRPPAIPRAALERERKRHG